MLRYVHICCNGAGLDPQCYHLRLSYYEDHVTIWFLSYLCPFYGMCRKALDLLKVNRRVLSGGNHNPIIDEHLNRCLNAGLLNKTNECNFTCIALKAILLLIYA
jgi:hypothetical protein